MKHKRLGFTIVELMIVIVIIGILVSITSIAYRETQKNARNEKRKTDVAMLTGALEDYRADKGDYPRIDCTGDPGTQFTCWSNQVWTTLKNNGYLRDVPNPDASSPDASKNTRDDGKANYGYVYGSPSAYSIYVPFEPASMSCKTGKNVDPGWWPSTNNCDF